MKSRAIFWVVIILLALAALVLIVTLLRPPKTGTVTAEKIQREAARLKNEVTRLGAELTQLRTRPELQSMTDSLNLAEGLLERARAQADSIVSTEDLNAAVSRLQRTRSEQLDAARRILKSARRRLPAPTQ